MTQSSLTTTFDRVDRRIAGFMAETGIKLLRISIGIVYLWFGALKVIGVSPAAPLINAAWDFTPIPPHLFVQIVGVMEILIGLGFISRIAMRLVIGAMLAQMLGAMSPLVLAPERMWAQFPHVLTLEGQYVIKDIILISAALVIGATVRGGGLTEKPEVKAIDEALEQQDQDRRKVA